MDFQFGSCTSEKISISLEAKETTGKWGCVKGSSAKGPQWVTVVLGEWLNGGKGLAGNLGSGVVGTVGGHIVLKGGWVSELSRCLLN